MWFQNRRAKWRRKEVRDREKKKSKEFRNLVPKDDEMFTPMSSFPSEYDSSTNTYQTPYRSYMPFADLNPPTAQQIYTEAQECAFNNPGLPSVNEFMQGNVYNDSARMMLQHQNAFLNSNNGR